MKIYSISFLVITFSWVGCKVEAPKANATATTDTIAPAIQIYGNIIDTAYLNTFYINPGAYVIDEFQSIDIKMAGAVNTASKGTCYLDYDAEDAVGNKAATITRTVHVIESKTAFLNGTYDVACTCTLVSEGSAIPKVSVNNYTAAVMLSQTNDQFELVQLNIGPEYVIPLASLSGNNINLSFYINSECVASGTLAAAKNSFIIETAVENVSKTAKYKCKNLYTKTIIVN